ncbi:hypothetical protein DAPPUDRAFT_67963 [Daphnia pulex]|uniref:F-box domain-containing protein n=1 Tax=Daphnia pulex TaxID=6669 RepID=E9I0K4_DAPPU|nr:hypothetical protein DAPPUDRAFT_67963 [Daphnia pulex]|eukprot:EFX62476.1 hypothetical protein DAPPUDRAFT_67963 [Daphnia pulex]
MSNESIIGGYPHLTEKILNLLDARSLANAELVCRQWRSFIADGRCWKKYLLSEKVKPRFDFFNMLNLFVFIHVRSLAFQIFLVGLNILEIVSLKGITINKTG